MGPTAPIFVAYSKSALQIGFKFWMHHSTTFAGDATAMSVASRLEDLLAEEAVGIT